MTKKSVKLIQGKYAAEVTIELQYSDDSWSPTMSLDDARKLDAVRVALRHGYARGRGDTDPSPDFASSQ